MTFLRLEKINTNIDYLSIKLLINIYSTTTWQGRYHWKIRRKNGKIL